MPKNYQKIKEAYLPIETKPILDNEVSSVEKEEYRYHSSSFQKPYPYRMIPNPRHYIVKPRYSHWWRPARNYYYPLQGGYAWPIVYQNTCPDGCYPSSNEMGQYCYCDE